MRGRASRSRPMVKSPAFRMMPFSKKLKKIVKIQCPDACQFQFQKGILARIDVHRMDMGRTGQGIVQCIASRRGNHQQAVFGSQLQRLPVQAGIFQQVL